MGFMEICGLCYFYIKMFCSFGQVTVLYLKDSFYFCFMSFVHSDTVCTEFAQNRINIFLNINV